jgi:hypothetical protein
MELKDIWLGLTLACILCRLASCAIVRGSFCLDSALLDGVVGGALIFITLRVLRWFYKNLDNGDLYYYY